MTIFQELAELYADMESAYTACALEASLSCMDCPTNCCTSYFKHHTYVEWLYLWQGLRSLPIAKRQYFLEKARAYHKAAQQDLACQALPSAMCPLNEKGLCSLYSYRLMICRMHGTRNVLVRPDGEKRIFSGCTQFCTSYPPGSNSEVLAPTLDRTPFYSRLANLEVQLLKKQKQPMPRVNLTLAEMMVLGPPRLSTV